MYFYHLRKRQILVFAPADKKKLMLMNFIFQSENTTEVDCSCEINYTGNGINCVSI